MRIQHNITAMNAYRNYSNNTSALAKNLEKLSSGYKINRAGDDAAGLAISEKMRAQISGLEQAQSNAKSGINLVQTAEGALTEVHDMLNRMVTLSEQSANGTYDDDVDRVQLQKEVDQLRSEIDRIADSSNFNGIKLLDGSLSDGAVATSIDITGVASSKSAATKGVYEAVNQSEGFPKLCVESLATTMTGNGGDTVNYTVSLSDGTSYSVKLTTEWDKTNNSYSLVAEDGTKYDCSKYSGVDNAFLSELKKTGLSDYFDITSNGADDETKENRNYGCNFTFTALEEGTATPSVAAIDVNWTVNGVAYTETTTGADNKAKMAIGVATTAAVDEGKEISADSIIEYDGTNYEDAVFTINGEKFVLLTEDMTGADTEAADDVAASRYLRAVQALGEDVTVLVGGTGGLKNAEVEDDEDATAANKANFQQNIKAIADATGLTVTDAITEATSSNGIDAGAGIRLSIGKNTTDKSLTLQIGDTAEDFNKLKVSINDCHADAMGIGDIDISTQDGASTAMDKIKDAINYVSDVRGTLGATQNRLDHTINNLSVMQENIQDAESTIRDVDVAEEMMEYTKNNILVQSAQAMLAQANQLPQGVLQLLQ